MSVQDNELDAMQSILAALQSLDEQERIRVLRWAWARFEGDGVALSSPDAGNGSTPVQREFADVAELMDACRPSTGPERALCVGYYLQEIDGRQSWGGLDVNSALKHLGHPLANVTKTLDSLRGQKPALVMQVSKAGKSQQARKTYRLTVAGLERVRQMLTADTEANQA